MDIYQRSSRWKIILSIAGLVIVLITMYYSYYLAKQLEIVEQNNVELFVRSLVELNNNEDLNKDISVSLEILDRVQGIPVILEDEDGYMQGYNLRGEDFNEDQEYLGKEKESIIKKGNKPIKGPPGYTNKIYYKNSRLYTLITYFPIIQILLLGAFILLGYFLFNSSRRAEQNRVWAGMAKETAHQLGTPLSAIMAWVEILKDKAKDSEDHEIVQELTKDVNRLELVADRFSKIGSTPSLEQTDLSVQVENCVNYMKRRMPKKVKVGFTPKEGIGGVNINRHLFDWVVENLIRNALDAMDGSGEINARVYDDHNAVYVDVSDTGEGIPANKFKSVFQPGYSTKKRGWGLGLSLAKRIIEEYHKGKIYIKKSVLNEGTTFTIKLPKA